MFRNYKGKRLRGKGATPPSDPYHKGIRVPLSDILDYPLSDADINAILEPDTSIFIYRDLEKVRSIDDVFDRYGRAMMLYPTDSETTGHWVCMIKRDDGSIEFFDPYGKPVDSQLRWAGGMRRREELGADEPLLTRLLKGRKVIVNRHPYQKNGDDIATCGRHCVGRLLLKDLSLKQYNDVIKETGLPADEFVARLTYPILGK